MSRWPDPVRPPLPVGELTEQDIRDTVTLIVRTTTEPEDPAFDVTAHAGLYAAQAALAECADIIALCRIEAQQGGMEVRVWERLGKEYAAKCIARKLIGEVRRWLPLTLGERPCERCGCDAGGRDFDCPDPCPCPCHRGGDR